MWYNDGSESGGGWGPPGMVQEPEEEETDKSVYFEATPKQAENGALYSYNIMATSPGGAITASLNFPQAAAARIAFSALWTSLMTAPSAWRSSTSTSVPTV